MVSSASAALHSLVPLFPPLANRNLHAGNSTDGEQFEKAIDAFTQVVSVNDATQGLFAGTASPEDVAKTIEEAAAAELKK